MDCGGLNEHFSADSLKRKLAECPATCSVKGWKVQTELVMCGSFSKKETIGSRFSHTALI